MNENQPETASAPERAQQLAIGYFREGLNCAECVVLSFMDTHDTNMSKDVLALTTGFGGGIGQTKHICGAITGAVMALGLEKGRRDPMASQIAPRERAAELRQIYPHFAGMVKEITDRYGTLICSELSAPHGDFDDKPRRKNCQEIVGFCANLAARKAEN